MERLPGVGMEHTFELFDVNLVEDTLPPDSVEYEEDVTVPDLRLHDQPSSNADESTGIDPYDTAKLHKK